MQNHTTRFRGVPKPLRLLSIEQVQEKTGLAAATIYKAIAAGWFPPARKLGPRAVRWIESEIDDWACELPTAELKAAA